MRDVLSEVYAVVVAMGEQWVRRIPEDVWQDIIAKKNNDYEPKIDRKKALDEQGLAKDTITFISLLHSEFWCDSEEERARLLAIFDRNQAEWDTKIAATGSVRGILRMVNRG